MATDYLAVPVWGKNETIRAWAIVSMQDVPMAVNHRWHFTGKGPNPKYVGTTIHLTPGRHGRKETLLLHRAVMGLAVGDTRACDHINREPLDCRRENLRFATTSENCQNRSNHRYRGTSRNGNGWSAHCKLKGQTTWLGTYSTREEAANVAAAWRREHMPFSEMDKQKETK